MCIKTFQESIYVEFDEKGTFTSRNAISGNVQNDNQRGDEDAIHEQPSIPEQQEVEQEYNWRKIGSLQGIVQWSKSLETLGRYSF